MKLIIERYNDLAVTSSTLLGTAHWPSTVAHVLCVVVLLDCNVLNKLLLEIMKEFSRTLCKQDISTEYNITSRCSRFSYKVRSSVIHVWI